MVGNPWLAPIVAFGLCACSPSDQAGPGPDTPQAPRTDCLGEVPGADCFARIRRPYPPDPASDNVALATEIAKRQMAVHPAAELAWNWEEAVLMAGLVELYRVTQAPELLAYMKAWMDHHIEAGYTIQSSDTCAPAAIAAFLWQETQDWKYASVVQDAIYYLEMVALRTPEGGISHLGTFAVKTLWIDSLYMFGNVLIEWASAQKEVAPWRDEGADAVMPGDVQPAGMLNAAQALDMFGTQYGIFAAKLQDDSGFFTHASDWVVEQTPGAFWARGNGWVVASGYSYLLQRIERGEDDATVRESLAKLTSAVLSVQDSSSGLWWTMLSHPGKYYLETSASALFAYGIARAWRYSLVDDAVLPKLSLALEGIHSRIAKDEEGRPIVTGISGPTSADKLEEYGKVPLEEDLPFGVGAVILALVETSGLPLAGGKP